MSTRVKLEELRDAYEWLSAGEAAAVDCSAYVNRATGAVIWLGDGVDEEPPEDIEDEDLYAVVPEKRGSHLGRSLAIRFVSERLPEQASIVEDFFRRRGAYSKFKSLLSQLGRLNEWHQYEDTEVEAMLRDWCRENGFELVAQASKAGN